MKKALFSLICALPFQIGKAQVLIALVFGSKLNTDKLEFGLTVSPTIQDITHIQSSARPGLDLGMYFNFKMSPNFFFHPELLAKSNFGANGIQPYSTGNAQLDSEFVGGSVQRKIQAFSLPLLARYRIHKLLFAEIGPQVDLLWTAKDVFKAKQDGNDLDYTIKTRDDYTWFALGVTGGLDYKLKKDKGMGLGLRYTYGLTDIMKSIGGNQHYTLWMLNVEIPIGIGKPASKNPPAGNPSGK